MGKRTITRGRPTADSSGGCVCRCTSATERKIDPGWFSHFKPGIWRCSHRSRSHSEFVGTGNSQSVFGCVFWALAVQSSIWLIGNDFAYWDMWNPKWILLAFLPPSFFIWYTQMWIIHEFLISHGYISLKRCHSGDLDLVLFRASLVAVLLECFLGRRLYCNAILWFAFQRFKVYS